MENAKFLYAIARSGQVVRIPLSGGPLNRAEIGEKLISSGISVDQLGDVGFTLRKPGNTKAFTVEERQAIAQTARSMSMPPFPKPNSDNMLPGFSEIAKGKSIGLKEMSAEGMGYYMQRAGSAEWIDVLSLPKGDFLSESDYDLVNSDRVKLCYGKVWRLVDQQNISPGIKEYTRTSVFKSGITEKTTLEIEASLGYEGYGASVSLRVLFKSEFTVTKENTQTEEFKFEGKEGVVVVFGLWQECDIFMVEVDGKRRDDPIFSLTLKDKHDTPYMVYDRFDGILNLTERDQAEVVEVPIT